MHVGHAQGRAMKDAGHARITCRTGG
jgi:hypothetical protein